MSADRWQAVRVGGGYNVATSVDPESWTLFLTYPLTRLVHAKVLAPLVDAILPLPLPVGLIHDRTMARLCALRASMQRFELEDRSRSIPAAWDAWGRHVATSRVWTDANLERSYVGRYECRPARDEMGDSWAVVPGWAEPRARLESWEAAR